MEDTKKRNARNNAWAKENSKKYTFKFMLKSDADIIAALESSENKAGLVRKAIREYMKQQEK